MLAITVRGRNERNYFKLRSHNLVGSDIGVSFLIFQLIYWNVLRNSCHW